VSIPTKAKKITLNQDTTVVCDENVPLPHKMIGHKMIGLLFDNSVNLRAAQSSNSITLMDSESNNTPEDIYMIYIAIAQ
jgi:hypothetical protein